MSRLTLFLEIINTLIPLALIKTVIQEDWDRVLPVTIALLLAQIAGLVVYLRDYYAFG